MNKIYLICFILGITWVVSLLIENEKTIKNQVALSNKLTDTYIRDYKDNLNKSDVELVNAYVQSLPTMNLSNDKYFQRLDNKETTGISILDIILSNPEFIESTEFTYPFQQKNLVKAIGEWRCLEDDKVDTISINHREKVHTRTLNDLGTLNIDCSHFESGRVVRKGNELGEWIILLPNSDSCPIYINDSSDSKCAGSLRSFMAEDMAAKKLQLKHLVLNEDVIKDGIIKLNAMQFSKATSEVFKGYPVHMNSENDEKEPTYKNASTSFNDLIASIQTNKPRMILSDNETYAFNENHYFTLARLWDGSDFTTVRLSPNNFKSSVVVVIGQFSDPRLLEIKTPKGIMYLDLAEKKVFMTFESWIKFLLAKRRLFESGYEFKYLPNDN